MISMTPQEKELLLKLAPGIKFSLNWLVQDAIIRNDETKPGDYSPELECAIELSEIMNEIANG